MAWSPNASSYLFAIHVGRAQAIKYYQQSLSVSKDGGNLGGQGQAYYCLGSTYSMQKNYAKAIECHLQHVAVAKELNDKSGILRGYYNLRNAHYALKEEAEAQKYPNHIIL